MHIPHQARALGRGTPQALWDYLSYLLLNQANIRVCSMVSYTGDNSLARHNHSHWSLPSDMSYYTHGDFKSNHYYLA